jgi:hypothetical protein
MSKMDSGRIETILACAVLAAVIGLFAKFYRPDSERAPEVPSAAAPADVTPATATN